ncbi:MAG: hypothetical protein FE78DRAFT_139419 [Acidomyces sp. 'richmondensis']|nr:MAG: hypothetical protein FE78DRAFT_139419 [Acidomyces sp. 'richmondensis']
MDTVIASQSEDPLTRLADLLKHPDDLDKLPSIKSDFARKKAAIDAQLKLGLSEQLTITQNGMSNISEGQKIIVSIKEEMMKIDRLCSEAQGMIRDFPEINKLSVMQRNFSAVESMKESVDEFAGRLVEIGMLLDEDDVDAENEPTGLGNQPNLLAIHEGLSSLRDVRDQAMDQVQSAGPDGESGETLRDYFTKLDELVDWFDSHVGEACMRIIELVQAGKTGLVVRLGLVIEEEEKKDRQVKALQDAQREFQDVASRFKSIKVGHRELREYKKKFLQAVEYNAANQFEAVKKSFADDPERLEKSCRWFFNDLNTVKLGMVDLLPKRWKIFRTYCNIYHKLMHDFLVDRLDDQKISPNHMLHILNWVPKYYQKLTRLGVENPELSLKPHVIDDREADLVREYRSLITRAVQEWMDRMTATDKKMFHSREEGSLDQDADGYLHTKSLGDMWTMLREQLAVAQQSQRPDVVEGVVDAMMRALKSRQKMWENLLDGEYRKIEILVSQAASPSDVEGLSAYQDWLVAVANDQITCIDDTPETTSFLTRFKQDYEPLVSPSYPLTNSGEIESLTNGYIDLASHSMHLFASLLFSTDFRMVTKTFFTQQWYSERAVQQITTTFEDYLSGENNVMQVLHPSLRDILVEELADALLVSYLEGVKNRGVKFRRSDDFTGKIRDDVMTVFKFFSTYPDTFELIKDKWRVVSSFENLLSADKGQGVVEAFQRLKSSYWDVQIGWVESVLRARDDFDRAMLSSVKNAAASMDVKRGPETVMSKIK